MEKAYERRVWLKSGGYLVIDHAEALTAIDVNTGKFVGKHSFEETVFAINCEAAAEIAHQLRLRDVGGIVVIDFIDMELAEHREELLCRLQDALARDRAKIHLAGFTKSRPGGGTDSANAFNSRFICATCSPAPLVAAQGLCFPRRPSPTKFRGICARQVSGWRGWPPSDRRFERSQRSAICHGRASRALLCALGIRTFLARNTTFPLPRKARCRQKPDPLPRSENS